MKEDVFMVRVYITLKRIIQISTMHLLLLMKQPTLVKSWTTVPRNS